MVPDPSMLTDPQVSPLFVPDLSGLPSAIVVTCEHDPLRDQGEAYAARLREAGVSVTARREPGMVHNFMLWDTISPACAAAADRVAADLKRRWPHPTSDGRSAPPRAQSRKSGLAGGAGSATARRHRNTPRRAHRGGAPASGGR